MRANIPALGGIQLLCFNSVTTTQVTGTNGDVFPAHAVVLGGLFYSYFTNNYDGTELPIKMKFGVSN